MAIALVEQADLVLSDDADIKGWSAIVPKSAA